MDLFKKFVEYIKKDEFAAEGIAMLALLLACLPGVIVRFQSM